MYTFLIADDESIERQGLSYLLSQREYPIRVIEAANGEEALNIINTEQVDVLITDIRMPFIDGLELACLIRKRDKDMKILICTAYSEFDYAQKAISNAVTAYILKPIQRKEFYEKIDRVIAELDEKAKLKQSVSVDMEKTWYALSHGYTVDENIINMFDECGLSAATIKPVLMLAIFPHDEMERYAGMFENGLKDIVSGIWIVSNCSTMLILQQDSILQNEMLIDLGNHIQQMLATEIGVVPKILISQPENGIYGLTVAWRRLEAQRELRLYADVSVCIPDAEHTNEDENVLLKMNALVLEAKAALDRSDVLTALSRLTELTSSIKLIKNMSAMYLRYIAMDVITALIRSKLDPSVVKPSMEEILSAHSTEQIAELLERHIRYLADKAQAENTDAIDTILATVHRHYNETLTLDILARSVYLTPQYVSFLFKQRTGTTLIKYINEYRLMQAEKMLRKGDKSITEIALQVGYDNSSYFGSLFKNRFGMSPTQYVHSLKEAGEKET